MLVYRNIEIPVTREALAKLQELAMVMLVRSRPVKFDSLHSTIRWGCPLRRLCRSLQLLLLLLLLLLQRGKYVCCRCRLVRVLLG
jgi:hypothetical protein